MAFSAWRTTMTVVGAALSVGAARGAEAQPARKRRPMADRKVRMPDARWFVCSNAVKGHVDGPVCNGLFKLGK